MLVLSRKTGERIQIGSDITIMVVEVQGNRVKIGIGAPASVPILRSELQAAPLAFERSSAPAGKMLELIGSSVAE